MRVFRNDPFTCEQGRRNADPRLCALETYMSEQLRAFLRLKQVIALSGMSRSWIYSAIQRGEFPAQISLGARAVGWDSLSLKVWQDQRRQRSEAQK